MHAEKLPLSENKLSTPSAAGSREGSHMQPPQNGAVQRLQSSMRASVQTQQLAQMQHLANDSPQVKQLRQWQSMVQGQALQRQATQGGLPLQLQSGIESLSGVAMHDVRVHYNSSKPAQLQAHAYAQGTEIHIAPGQERHLPHEAWHVVQQKQGRVKPTLQLKGVAINDDSALEREADVMGAKAQAGGSPQGELRQKSLVSLHQPKQLKGRKGKLDPKKTVLKVVLPGSGYMHWASHDKEKTDGFEKLYKEDDKDPQYAWMHPDKDEWEVTIAGPQAYKGTSDTGKNSIENNFRLAVMMLIEKIATLKKEGVEVKDIAVLIKGHSRNGVTATRLANFLAEKYASDGMIIELVAFDPVPGPGHEKEDVDIKLDPAINSTVVYSLITEYSAGFGPQVVAGSKRMIISLQGHSAGLIKNFVYSGKIYKGSNLNSLPEGLYGSMNMWSKRGHEGIMRIQSELELDQFLLKHSPTMTTQGYRLAVIEKLGNAFKLAKNRDKTKLGKKKVE